MLQITCKHSSLRWYMYSFTYIQVLKLLTRSTVRMSPAARTVVSMQLSQLVQASKLCHRRAAARPLSRTSDKPSRPCLATRSAHRELFTTSQRQTMSTRSSSVKRCLPNASSSVDHVPKSTRPFLCGVKGHTWNIARRRETRLRGIELGCMQ